MFNFATSLAVLAVAASAQRSRGGDYGYATSYYGYDSYSRGNSYGYDDRIPTYSFRKESGLGIHQEPNKPKDLIGNDGYKIKVRTAVGERVQSVVNAKCVLKDPNEESEVSGIVSLTQAPGDEGTLISAQLWNMEHGDYELSIHALGNLADGCESVGDVFNPDVSENGFNKNGRGFPAIGDLGDVERVHDQGSLDQVADVDLSGTQSIVGRSIVLTRKGEKDRRSGRTAPDKNIACCAIGLSSGIVKSAKNDRDGRDRHGRDEGYGYDDSYGYDEGYGFDDSYGHDEGYGYDDSYGHDEGYGYDDSYGRDDGYGRSYSNGNYGYGDYGYDW